MGCFFCLYKILNYCLDQPAPQVAKSVPVALPSPDLMKSPSIAKATPVSFLTFVVTFVKVTSVTFKSPLVTPAPVGLLPASPSKSNPSSNPFIKMLLKTP